MSTARHESPCGSLQVQLKDEPADHHPMPTKDEQAARFRAAFAWAPGYAGPKQIAEALGVSESTAKRLSSGKGKYDHELWEDVIEITGVPRWFIDDGWDGANVPSEVGLAERVERLENEVGVLLKILRGRVARALADHVTGQPTARPEGPVDQPGKDHPT